MRGFLAIDLEYPARLGERVGAEPHHFHLTLRFLGEIDEETAAAVGGALREAAGRGHPFSVELRGLGAFPSAAAPRIVWVGVGEGARECTALVDGLAGPLAALGVAPEDRPYRPHATLRRIRGRSDREWAARILAGTRSDSFGVQPVREAALYESVLTPAGAEHRRRVVAPLGGAAL